MKQSNDQCDPSLSTNNERKFSHSKTLISRQIFGQQHRKKRRMHTNSILNQLKLSEKINQDNFLLSQQKSLRKFQNSRKNSIRITKKKMSQLNLNSLQTEVSCRISHFCQSSNNLFQEQLFSNFKQQKDSNFKQKLSQSKISQKFENKKFLIHQAKKKKKQQKPKNTILNSINIKLRQLNVISRTFDKVNQSYCIQSNINQQKYGQKGSEADKILKDFSSKLTMRKNLITQRKNSLKKNIKLDYRYKVAPKRFQTQTIDKQNNEGLNISNKIQRLKGIWHQDARKLKNYISGGYADQRQQYSEVYDLEEYRKIRKNFQTFEQIYNSIKQDKDNPIGKIYGNSLKQPNMLQLVSIMQKQQQLDTTNLI